MGVGEAEIVGCGVDVDGGLVGVIIGDAVNIGDEVGCRFSCLLPKLVAYQTPAGIVTARMTTTAKKTAVILAIPDLEKERPKMSPNSSSHVFCF